MQELPIITITVREGGRGAGGGGFGPTLRHRRQGRAVLERPAARRARRGDRRGCVESGIPTDSAERKRSEGRGAGASAWPEDRRGHRGTDRTSTVVDAVDATEFDGVRVEDVEQVARFRTIPTRLEDDAPDPSFLQSRDGLGGRR